MLQNYHPPAASTSDFFYFFFLVGKKKLNVESSDTGLELTDTAPDPIDARLGFLLQPAELRQAGISPVCIRGAGLNSGIGGHRWARRDILMQNDCGAGPL